jgi:hypothetical protein
MKNKLSLQICTQIEVKKQETLKVKRHVLKLLLLSSLFFIPGSNYAQFIQQGNKLIGTRATGVAAQGTSVSISSDGNTAVVGGPDDNNNTGAVWVFIRTNGAWNQQGSKLVGKGAKGAAYQGSSVSVSADGNTFIEGGPGDNNFLGAAWIFTRNNGVWSQKGSKLVGAGAVSQSAFQGEAVAISGNGNTAIVGGYNDNAAWVFTLNSGGWSQQGNKLVGTGGTGFSGQGRSVALSSDGNTAIVGGFTDGTHAGSHQTGASWIFTRANGIWSQQGNKLIGSGSIGNSYQGISVSLSSDGNTAAVGGWHDNSIGATWVFTRSGTGWSQQGSKLVGSGAVGAAVQGWSVSVSGDGNKIIVGGHGDNNNTGATWVFIRSGGAWSQQGNKLVGTGYVGSANEAASVSIASDGKTFIMGGYGDNSNVGAAWVFNDAGLRLAASQTYCTSRGMSTTNGFIKKVSMETINNTSGNNGGYADFTSQSATLLKGATYTIELTPGFSTGGYQLEYWTVYIDYNHDGVFEPNEIVGEGHNYIRVNKSFPVPATALNGATRMRIQMQANAQETNPCATFTYGEVEDYTVILTTSSPNLAHTNTEFNNSTENEITDFKLYPNPANNNLHLDIMANTDGNIKMNVYSLTGQKLMSLENPAVPGLNNFNLNTGKLTNGVYILKIENEGHTSYRRFMISK